MNEEEDEFLLKQMLNAVIWFDESLQLHLAAADWPAMSRTKSFIMLNIAQGMERPSQIAESLGLTRQAVHLAIKELERDGLVSLEDDPSDKRAKRVFFSKEDQRDKMRKEAVAALHQIEDKLSRRVGKKKFAIFRDVLGQDWGNYVSPEPDE